MGEAQSDGMWDGEEGKGENQGIWQKNEQESQVTEAQSSLASREWPL